MYMTVKEAYVIFYGIQETKITEETIRQKITREALRKKHRQMQKKFHHDANVGKREQQEKYNAISTDINIAYEILDGCLKYPNYINPYVNTKSVYLDYLNKRQKIVEKLKKDYKEKFYRALRIREYTLINRHIELTNKYYKEVAYYQDLPELYNKQQEYNQKVELILNEIASLEKEYKEIVSFLEKELDLEEDVLETKLQAFLQEDYYKIKKDDYYIRSVSWLKNELETRIHETDKKTSIINNLKSKIRERYDKAKKLFLKIDAIESQKLINLTLKKLENAITTEEKARIIENYENITYQIKENRKNCTMKYDSGIAILESLRTNEITKKWIDKFERDIEEMMVTKENLELLNDPKAYEEISDKITKNNRDYQKNINKLNSKIREERIIISVQLGKYKEQITEINTFINGEITKKTKKIGIISPASLTLLSEFQNVTKEIYKKYKEAIPIYRNCLISYFAQKSNNFDSVNKLLSQGYYNYKKNIDKPDVVERYYFDLKNTYDNCNNIRRFNDESTELNVKSNLISMIEEIKGYNDMIELPLPKYLEERYQKRYTLDINSLYELYVHIEEIYSNQFKLYKVSSKSQR